MNAPAARVLVRNRGNRDLFVTITDDNAAGRPEVWSQHRLNETSGSDVSLTLDGSNECRASWEAQEVDDPSRIESLSGLRLAAGDVIEVYVR